MEKHVKAFTLAETLLTLAIFGVIAALLISNITFTYKEKSTALELKTFLQQINEAFNLAERKNGPMETWDWGSNGNGVDAADVMNKIAPYLKLQKNCGNGTGCIVNKSYYNLNHTAVWGNAENSTNRAKAKFRDGSYIWLWTYGNSFNSRMCGKKVGKTNALENCCGAIAYDVNGSKGPNVFGIDLFQFYVTKQGVIPYGSQYETSGYESLDKFCNYNPKKKDNTNGYSCTAWLIERGDLAYLKKTINW